MKTTNRLCVFLSVASFSFSTFLLAEESSELVDEFVEVESENIRVKVDSSRALVQSYVNAFSKLRGVHKSLVLQYGEQLKQIDDVRSVVCINNVLVAKTRMLKSYIINPKNVLFFTDDSLDRKK